MRARALESLARTNNDLTDAELFASQTDEYWFVDLCMEQLHRLPSEINPIITCREYTKLQAYYIVKRAIADMQQSRRG